MSDDVIYINADTGSKRVMCNFKLYAKLLTKFKDDPNFNEMTSALAEGDMQKAQSFAHALKGIAANLSLIELHKQSVELEAQIKAGSVNPDQVASVKDVHAQTLTEIEKVIAQYA